MMAKKLNRRQARWSLLLARFDFIMHHRPGKSMGKTDALSRLSDHGTGSEDNNNMVLLTPNFFAVRALEALEAAEEERGILKDIWKGMWDGEKEEPVAKAARELQSSSARSKPSNARTAKKFGVRRTMLSLSSEPVPWSDRRDRASVFPMLLPGRWCMMKSNRAKSRDHLACLRLSFLAVIKYWRFLWSVQISQRCSAPSTKCLHSSNALTIANISLSWIS